LGGADARAFAVVQGRSRDVGAGIRRSAILRNLPSDKRKGACRHLIVDRMDVTGARLSVSGAEGILRLRSLRSSGDFDASRYAGKPVSAEEFQAMLLRQKTSPGSVPRG
jgi:hypothetical protein